MDVTKLLFALIRAGLREESVDAQIAQCINADTLEQLYTLSDSHDMAHILGVALAKSGKLGNDDNSKNFRGKAMLAVSRYERIHYDLQTLCQALEDAQIPFIPLKGSVIRAYYPQPWMRTSCDIDILVPNERLMDAAQVLRETLGYTQKEKGQHDISFYAHSGTHIELHYDLVEEGWANSASLILKNVWDYASPKDGFSYWQELSGDMFYYYHIAHMAKHVEQGGCGIRSFVDLWILDNAEQADAAKRNALLEKGNLMKFAQTARRLSQVWLEDAPHDAVTEVMQDFIFHGGVYGTMSNRILALQKREGGKLKYALSKIVIPYNTIKFMFPILQKHPWLTPIMQVCRWFRLVFGGHVSRSVKELSYSQNVPETQAEAVRQLFQEIGL